LLSFPAGRISFEAFASWISCAMGDEADVKGGQPWRFDIRIVSLDDLPQDVEGVAVLWAKGEVSVSIVSPQKHAVTQGILVVTIIQVRKSTPVCAAAAGRAVFEIPPVLGVETTLKMNDGACPAVRLDIDVRFNAHCRNARL